MDKIRDLGAMAVEREDWRRDGKTVVWTNGCFDILHAGHARALEAARALGDALIVGMNSDRSVRELKGGGRPVCGEADRAAMLGALAVVDRIVVFDGRGCDRELAALKPDIWTKSGDYTVDELYRPEREAVLESGGRIVITPLIEGLSTSNLIKRIRRHDPEKIVSAASAFIRDRRKGLLFVATRYADGTKWSLPGGGQARGESLKETAERETFEETGAIVAVDGYMGVVERVDRQRGLHLVLHMFRARPETGPDAAAFAGRTSASVADMAWFDRKRLAAEPRVVLGRKLWLEYFDAPEEWPAYVLLGPGDE